MGQVVFRSRASLPFPVCLRLAFGCCGCRLFLGPRLLFFPSAVFGSRLLAFVFERGQPLVWGCRGVPEGGTCLTPPPKESPEPLVVWYFLFRSGRLFRLFFLAFEDPSLRRSLVGRQVSFSFLSPYAARFFFLSCFARRVRGNVV